MSVRKWTDEQLEAAVKNSNCYTHVVTALGLAINNDTLCRIRKYVAKLGLDITHFITHEDRNRSRRTWTDEQLRNEVRNSKSISEVLRKLGLTVTSTNHGTVKRTIDRIVTGKQIGRAHV